VRSAPRWRPAAADEGLLNYSFGPDAGITDDNGSFAIVAGFEDAASYMAYHGHAAHCDALNRAIAPISALRRAVQYKL